MSRAVTSLLLNQAVVLAIEQSIVSSEVSRGEVWVKWQGGYTIDYQAGSALFVRRNAATNVMRALISKLAVVVG